MGAEEHRAESGDPAALAGRLFRDMTGALEILTVYLGERLGLYQALHASGAATSAELAARTGTVPAERGVVVLDEVAANDLAERLRDASFTVAGVTTFSPGVCT